MVLLSLVRLGRNTGPDEFWRKRKIFKLAAHFYGRRRNCYSLAIRGVLRALQAATRGRKMKKDDIRELRETRISAGAEEHGISMRTMMEGLTRNNILLNRKTLADLAVWEPRTFKALTEFACARVKQDGVRHVADTPMPKSVILRELIK